MKQNFIHLHNHTFLSTLDGVGSPMQYAKRASELGFSHLAITDHGNVDGAIKFQIACKEHNIIPIFGAELYIVEDINEHPKGENRGHITCLAKNKTGWNNLLKMITISNIDGFYYRPRISPEILLKHTEGLIIMSACSSSYLMSDWGRKLFQNLIAINKDDVYLEVMPHKFEGQYDINQLCYALSQEEGIKLVATNDIHYTNKEDAKLQEVLLAVQTHKKWNDPDRWKFQDSGSYYLKTKNEMIDGFRDQGILDRSDYMKAIDNTLEVAEKCSGFTSIDKLEVHLPECAIAKGRDDFEVLSGLCNLALFGSTPEGKGQIYRLRLNTELELIKQKKFERYFLIVYELVEWCKKNDIMTGPGRGSSSGSLVCYLLGITQADPIQYNLVFERFISPDRNDLPDVDIDFEDIKKPLIKKHLEEVYGKWNVAGVSTFSFMKGKGALRDVSRVFSIPLNDVNKACSVIETKLKGDEGYEDTIQEAFENFDEGIAFAKKYPEVSDIAMRLEGTVRQRGQHASAVVVSGSDLRNGFRCAFALGKDKEPIVNWDKDDIEHMGLMKLDILGLNMLTVMNNTKKLVETNKNIVIEFDKIPLDVAKCYVEFTKGNSVGCFQLGSPGLRKFCQQLEVDNFDSLIAATSLYRPGALRSGTAEMYIRRKHKEDDVPIQHPIIEDITRSTFGIIIFQEQVIRLVHELAGIEWKTVDKIRKVVAKSKGREAFMEYEQMFIDGCRNNKTLSETEASLLWNELATFGEYTFSLNHATPYSVITYWCMYLKLFHPVEYICSLLTYGSDDKDKRDEYIEEAYRLGLEIRPPKVNISLAYDWTVKDNILYAPFIEIKGVGDKTAQKFEVLNKAKEGFYESEKKAEKGLTQRFLNILDKINAYNDIGIDDEEADRIAEFIDINLVKNKLHKYKKLIALLKRTISVANANALDLRNTDHENKYYIGEITDLSLTVMRGKESKILATANFRDDSGYFKFTFHPELYNVEKNGIEQCEGQFVIMQMNVPKRAGSPVCNEIWFMDDILSGELGGLNLALATGGRFQNKELLNCTDCELRKECLRPVLPSVGKYNIMILGEAPGTDENRQGSGFVGDSGRVLWDEIEANGFTRKDFNVSNVCKCYPGRTIKTPDKTHIKACRKWLEEELTYIRPFLILALGNTNIKFFTDEESGIMNRSGKTEWNEKYGAFITYCIHPASTLYGPENKELFRDSIKAFCDKVRELGMVTF